MRYWILTTEYPPFHGGGIATFSYHTAQMLNSAGIEVSVFVADHKTGYINETSENGVKVIRFHPNISQYSSVLGHIGCMSYSFALVMKKFIHTLGKPDIVESQDYLGIAYYPLQFKHTNDPDLSNIPFLITLHSPAFLYLNYNQIPTYKYPYFLTCELEKHSIAAADLIIAPSQFIVDEIRKHMEIPSEKVHIIRNPLEFDTPPIPPCSTKKSRKIAYYGKLSPQKGTFELLNYFRELWQSGFNEPLHLIGGTDIVFHPENKTMGQIISLEFKKYIKSGHLVFHEKVKPDRIAKALSEIGIIIVPSLVDNLPYVVLESMALGKIVLTSIQGGQREIVLDGINGFTFDHETPGTFRKQLLRIFELTDAQTYKIQCNARQTVKDHFSYQTVFEQKKKALLSLPTTWDSFPFLYQETHANTDTVSDAPALLSVIIPYYNMGKFIGECINSIKQSHSKPCEIIIVNDGSTSPKCLQILEQLAHDPEIRVIHQHNAGLPVARNNGAENAKGNYIAFLDPDDRIHQNYYSKAIHILQTKKNVFFVGAWTRYFGRSSGLWPTYTPQPPHILMQNTTNSSGLIFRKNEYLNFGKNDPDLKYGFEDYGSVISMLSHGYNGAIIPEPLFYYRVRSGSMFRKLNRTKKLYLINIITTKHTSYFRKFSNELILLLNSNGPGFLHDMPSVAVDVRVSVSYKQKIIDVLKRWAAHNKFIKETAIKIKNLLNQ